MKLNQKCITTQTHPVHHSQLEESLLSVDLSQGWVLVKNQYSGLNYKDALALTGRGKILRKSPLVPGIDLCGQIQATRSSQWKEGDWILATGCGLGELFNGGYARYTLVHEDWCFKLPSSWTPQMAMKVGTAGLTAALALLRMEQMGQKPELGPLLITGASGGVGTWATYFFSQKGYSVWTTLRKASYHKTLLQLGAKNVGTLEELNLKQNSPLSPLLFGGAVDNLGGQSLSQILSHVEPWGQVASIGLVENASFQSTVIPFILRGISLLGISSTNAPKNLKEQAWSFIEEMTKGMNGNLIPIVEISLEKVLFKAIEMTEGKTFGRTLVKIS